jgi:DNA adenine methylase
MNNYHEIFLGGGSVLLAVLSLQKQGHLQIQGNIYAYDVNPALINVYQQIQSQPHQFFKFLSEYWDTYDNCQWGAPLEGISHRHNGVPEVPPAPPLGVAKNFKESYYYWVRSHFNQMDRLTPEGAAVFVFLNKTGFRGLYREGPNGYNVPYGHYKKTPVMISPSELEHIHQLTQDVKFACSSFQESLSKVTAPTVPKVPTAGAYGKEDFIYLDPPYVPENPQSFVKYTHDGFSLETHQELFQIVKQLHEKKRKLVLSNSNVPLVLNSFEEFSKEHLQVRRTINAKNPGSITTEVIIYN